MFSMLCNIWDDFRLWISDTWSTTTFALVVSILSICGLLLFLKFFKASYNKGGKIKWFDLVLALLVFGLVAIIFIARFNH
ncbi:MAG: hypothetical protein J6J24_02890 [Clostridia bacterium]|nr:hypothetical protein [Clostridia bacterium]